MRRVNTLVILGWVAMAAAGCTKRNPDVCCETKAECDTVGFSTPSPCDEGVCVNYSCAATGCDGDEDCRDPKQPTCVANKCYGPADACREGGGARIVFVSSRGQYDGLYGMYVNGSSPKRLVVSISADENMEYNVSPSPDGNSVAFVAAGASGNTSVFTVASDGQALTQVTNDVGEQANSVVWSPDGGMLAFSTGSLLKNAYVMKTDGTARSRLVGPSADSNYDPTWSADSKKVAFASSGAGDIDIWAASADGTEPKLIDSMPGSGAFGLLFQTPRWSPDGTIVAYLVSYPMADRDIFLKVVGGGPSTALHTEGVDESDIVWSHDSSRIAFVREQGIGRWDYAIWVMNADGTNQKRLTSGGSGDHHPRWSPDDKYILFDSLRDGNREVYRMDADGSNPTNLTNYAGDGDLSGEDFSAEWASCSL